MSDTVRDLHQRRQELLFFLFKKLSFSKVISNKTSNTFFILAIAFMGLAYGSMIFNVSHDSSTNPYAWIFLTSLIISLLFFSLQSLTIRNNIRKKFNRNDIVFDWTSNYSSFIHIHRADKLKNFLPYFKIDSFNIDEEILYYDSLHQSVIHKVWRNIGIMVVVTLPLWSELIGKVIDLDSTILLLLGISAVAISTIAMLVTYLIDNIFLAKVVKYKKIAAILRDIKQVL
ncbi:hypothetical protein [Paenibacillus kandeliae]|uniref:hypothetical protein n=1 Tax=Paenibacillus kandeliae TaxID=3231269 RepID=UPI00345810B1